MRCGRVLAECEKAARRRAGGSWSRAAARGIGTAPAGALLPQNARQGGRARAAAERANCKRRVRSSRNYGSACGNGGCGAAAARSERGASAGTEAAAAAPRRRGQQPGAAGHGRRGHAHLPVQVEAHDVEPERRRCPACGDEYGAHGSEDSEQLEIEVRAYRRVIKRRRYRLQLPVRGGTAAAHGAGAGTADPEGHPGHLGMGDGADRQVSAVPAHVPAAGGCARAWAGSCPRHGHRRYAASGTVVRAVAGGADRAQPHGPRTGTLTRPAGRYSRRPARTPASAGVCGCSGVPKWWCSRWTRPVRRGCRSSILRP